MAKAPKKPRTKFHKELIQSAREVIRLKAQGFTDSEIRARLELGLKQYRRRLDYIREGKVFELEARSLCVETIHRLKAVRDQAWLRYSEIIKTQDKKGAISALKAAKECDREIIDTAIALGFIRKGEVPKMQTPDEALEEREVVQTLDVAHMSDEELDGAYNALLQQTKLG